MNAYDIFCQDLMDDELNRARTDRQRYYSILRESLREEIMAGGRCELLQHYAKRLEPGAPGYMYLLDAGALWECFDAIFCSRRFPRPLGEGFPFIMKDGRRMPWPEVKRLQDQQALPVAVVDEQLRRRIESLNRYAHTPLEERRKVIPQAVNEGAKLTVTSAIDVPPIPVPGADSPAEVPAEVLEVRSLLAQREQELARVLAENETLRAEAKRKPNRPGAQPEDEELLVDMLLKNRLAEAAERWQRIDSDLAERVRSLEKLEAACAAARTDLERVNRQIEVDREELEECRSRKQHADEEAARIRIARTEAEKEVAASLAAKEAEQRALAHAQEELVRLNEELQEIRRLRSSTGDAIEQTRWQKNALS